MTQRLSPPFAFKASGVDAAGEFSGYASTWDPVPDSFGHVVKRGAFTKSLAEFRSENRMPAMLWSHNPQQPIGRWLSLAEDSKGLAVEGRLTLAVDKGREAYALMRDSALSLSIGYEVRPDGIEQLKGGASLLTDLKLHEISPVALPANYSARILSVKSAIACGTIAEFEDWARDVGGLSRNKAKKFASVG